MAQVKVLEPVDFYGQALTVIDRGGDPYVVMKPVVEGMGLDWAGQFKKLTKDPERWGVELCPYLGSGGEQQVLCLPLKNLPFWLTSVQSRRVRPEIAEQVRLYQKECVGVLWAYWSQGVALNPRAALTANEILLQAVQALVDQERAVAELRGEQRQIVGRVEAIEQRAAAAQRELLALPAPGRPVEDLSLRARINRVVRDYAFGHGSVAYSAAWGALYREYRDRCHVDLARRAAHARCSALDVAEELGADALEDLYAVAYEIFVEHPIPVPRDQ